MIKRYLTDMDRMEYDLETKRNETKRNETKRNETKRNETKRNETKRNDTKRNALTAFFFAVQKAFYMSRVYMYDG